MSQIRDPQLLKEVADRIKYLRAQNRVTQDMLFNKTNIHIGRVESGKINISISTLQTICNYFNITLSEFFQGIENR